MRPTIGTTTRATRERLGRPAGRSVSVTAGRLVLPGAGEAAPDDHTIRPRPSQKGARMAFLSIFPYVVLGRSDTKSTDFGFL